MLKREISGFLAVGALGAVVDFGLFNMLFGLGFGALQSSIISVSSAGVAVFLGNLFLSFSHVKVKSKLRAGVKFFFLAVATVAANNFLVSIAILAIGEITIFEANLVKVGVILLLMLFRFAIMKFFIYVG